MTVRDSLAVPIGAARHQPADAQGRVAAAIRPVRRAGSKLRVAPYMYLAPMLILLVVFTYWPFFHTVYLSLVQWNLTMAATVLVMLPVIVVFFLAQKAFVEGVTLTGVKG